MTETLARVAREHQAKGGGGFVAVDTRTGEVLVLASHAGEEAGGLHLGAASVTPGSVFKIVTAAAGLESGTLDPSETFECNRRWHGVGCSHSHGTVDLLEAISGSCNKYFARVADRLKAPDRREIEVLAHWARRLGFLGNHGPCAKKRDCEREESRIGS